MTDIFRKLFRRISKLNSVKTEGSHTNKDDLIDLLGVQIPLDMPVLSEHIITEIRSGKYEQQEARQLKHLMQPGERVLELGAGIGFISTLIISNPNVEYYRGYEANPELIPWIEAVFKLNQIEGQVENSVLLNNSTTDQVDFYLRKHFWASSLSPDPWAYERKVKVPVENLNHVVAQIEPTLIVCDIEGGELDLFRDASLKGVKKVYMEVHQNVLGRKGMRELFDSMSRKDFHYDQNHSCGAVILFNHIDH